jgi:hypothetical protein
MWAYQEAPGKTLKVSTLKFFMESYFELLFCFILNVIAWTRAKDIEELKEFFTGFSNIMCSILCIVYGICIIAFPFHGMFIIVKNREIL